MIKPAPLEPSIPLNAFSTLTTRKTVTEGKDNKNSNNYEDTSVILGIVFPLKLFYLGKSRIYYVESAMARDLWLRSLQEAQEVAGLIPGPFQEMAIFQPGANPPKWNFDGVISCTTQFSEC